MKVLKLICKVKTDVERAIKMHEADEFIKPIMVDPSLLLSRHYLWRLSEYNDVLYIPSSFKKIIEKREVETILDFYSKYLRKEGIATYGEQYQFFGKENVLEFSKEMVEEYPEEMYLHLEYLKELKPPLEIKEIIEEELIFLYTYSGLISRLKNIFDIFNDIKMPIIDITRSVPKEWQTSVKGMKKLCNWIAFLADLSMTADLLHATSVALIINGIRMFIIDL